VEGLSRLILKLVEKGKIEGVLVANGIRITHLLFVDDVILFGNGFSHIMVSFKGGT
jgi:hypothetical protein